MKNLPLLLAAILGFGLLFSCSSEKEIKTGTVELKTKSDSASWVIGIQMADNFKRQNLDEKLNKKILMTAMEMQFESDSLLFDLEEGNRIVSEFLSESSKSNSQDKIKAGEAFLAENAKKEGITVTESGLQYEIITQGTGEIPNENNTVETNYKGTLLDGTVFDSSYDRGSTAKFPVNGVIKGWIEALQLMPVGSKWKLYIPYDLAYGERGAGGVIGPYETLIFEIELISIVK